MPLLKYEDKEMQTTDILTYIPFHQFRVFPQSRSQLGQMHLKFVGQKQKLSANKPFVQSDPSFRDLLCSHPKQAQLPRYAAFLRKVNEPRAGKPSTELARVHDKNCKTT